MTLKNYETVSLKTGSTPKLVKTYTLLYSVRRETTGIGPTDEHSLISSIWRIENGKPEQIGLERKTVSCRRVRRDYDEDFKPSFDTQYLDQLARRISAKFPFEDGDKVVNLPNRVSAINVAQYPVDISDLTVFREKLIEHSRS